MKKYMKKIQMAILIFFCTLGMSMTVNAAGYVREEGTNVYIIAQTGNITDTIKEIIKNADGITDTTIKLLPGTYQVGVINITKSHIKIDATKAVLESDKSADYILRIADCTVSDISVKGGKWDGKNAIRRIFHIVSGVGKVQNLQLEDCELTGSSEAMIRMDGVSNCVMKNIKVEKSACGIRVIDGKNINMENVKVNKSVMGISLSHTTGRLVNCVVSESEQDGLQIRDSADIIMIGGSYCKNGKNGISITRGGKLTMRGAEVSNNLSNGVSPVGTKGQETRFEASESYFNYNGRHGVAADIYVILSIQDSEAKNNAANGIFLNTNSQALFLKNIIVTGNGRTQDKRWGIGILIQGGSTCKIIENCVCDNNSKLGISLTDVSTTINECSMSGNSHHGLNVSGKKKNSVTVKSCAVKKNGRNGIMMQADKLLNLKNTTITENKNCGIEARSSIVKVTGKKTLIANNKKHGIACKKGKLTVTGVTIQNNKKYGLYYDGTKDSFCVDSKLVGNGRAIVLSNGAVVKKVIGNKFKKNKRNIDIQGGTGTSVIKVRKKNKGLS